MADEAFFNRMYSMAVRKDFPASYKEAFNERFVWAYFGHFLHLSSPKYGDVCMNSAAALFPGVWVCIIDKFEIDEISTQAGSNWDEVFFPKGCGQTGWLTCTRLTELERPCSHTVRVKCEGIDWHCYFDVCCLWHVRVFICHCSHVVPRFGCKKYLSQRLWQAPVCRRSRYLIKYNNLHLWATCKLIPMNRHQIPSGLGMVFGVSVPALKPHFDLYALNIPRGQFSYLLQVASADWSWIHRQIPGHSLPLHGWTQGNPAREGPRHTGEHHRRLCGAGGWDLCGQCGAPAGDGVDNTEELYTCCYYGVCTRAFWVLVKGAGDNPKPKCTIEINTLEKK